LSVGIAFSDRDTLFDFERTGVAFIMLRVLPPADCGTLTLEAVTPAHVDADFQFFDGDRLLGTADREHVLG